jgi:hypothetical protein
MKNETREKGEEEERDGDDDGDDDFLNWSIYMYFFSLFIKEIVASQFEWKV